MPKPDKPKIFLDTTDFMNELTLNEKSLQNARSLLTDIKKAYDALGNTETDPKKKYDKARANVFLNEFIKTKFHDLTIHSAISDLYNLEVPQKESKEYDKTLEKLKTRLSYVKFFMPSEDEDNQKYFQSTIKKLASKLNLSEENFQKFYNDITFSDLKLDENDIDNMNRNRRHYDSKDLYEEFNTLMTRLQTLPDLESVDRNIKYLEDQEARLQKTYELINNNLIKGEVNPRNQKQQNLPEDQLDRMAVERILDKYGKGKVEIKSDIAFIVNSATALRERYKVNESHGFLYKLFFSGSIKRERDAINRELERLTKVSENPEILTSFVTTKDDLKAQPFEDAMLKAETAKLALCDPSTRKQVYDELSYSLLAIHTQCRKETTYLQEYEEVIEKKNKELSNLAEEISKKIIDPLYIPVEKSDLKSLPRDLAQKLESYSIEESGFTLLGSYDQFETEHITTPYGEVWDNHKAAKNVDKVFLKDYFNIKAKLYLSNQKFIKEKLDQIKENPGKISVDEFREFAKTLYGNYHLMETIGLFDRQATDTLEEGAIINRECAKTQEMFVNQIKDFQTKINEMNKFITAPSSDIEEIKEWGKGSVNDSVFVKEAGIKDIKAQYEEISKVKNELNELKEMEAERVDKYFVQYKDRQEIAAQNAEEVIKEIVSKKAKDLVEKAEIDPNKKSTEDKLLDLSKEFTDDSLDLEMPRIFEAENVFTSRRYNELDFNEVDKEMKKRIPEPMKPVPGSNRYNREKMPEIGEMPEISKSK